MYTCGKCHSKMSEGPLCSSCSQHFDYQCAGISEANFRKLGSEKKASWRCSTCRAGPAVATVASPKSPSTPDMSTILAAIQKLSDKMKPIDLLVKDMGEVKSDLGDLKSSVELAHSWMKELGDTVKSFDGRLTEVEKVADEMSVLQSSIKKIELSLNDKDQWSRLSNIEIKGVPLIRDENLFEVLGQIARKAAVPIRKEDLNFISRIATRDKDAPKPIIACFNNRYLKENLVSAVRSLKGLSTSDLGFHENSKIFVNDHLTAANKQLLSKTKAAAKANHYQFVWVRQCKIMLRKNVTSPFVLIKTEEDLKKIIC